MNSVGELWGQILGRIPGEDLGATFGKKFWRQILGINISIPGAKVPLALFDGAFQAVFPKSDYT